MNKKGFTLVELLAVIVLLAVVTLMASVSITGIQRKMHAQTLNSQLMHIVTSAINFGEDHREDITASGTSITVRDLLGEDYLSSVLQDKDTGEYYIKNDITGENINALTVKIYLKSSRVYACIENTSDNIELLTDELKSEYYCS